MKRFLMIVVLALMCISIHPAIAGMRTFEWDANTPTPDGYKAYRNALPNVAAPDGNLWLTIWNPNSNPYPTDPAHIEYTYTDTTQTKCILTVNVLPAGMWNFVWTAFNIDEESGKSNEVLTEVFPTPADPTGLSCSP